MIDNDMTNILRNFSNADAGSGEITNAKTGELKVSSAATEKNAMKAILEGLDAQQKSVNQMPGQHTMSKNTTSKHPASKFLVGGEFDEEVTIEPEEEAKPGLTHEDIADAWMQEFPNSSVAVSKAFGGGYTFKFRLAKDKSEVSSQIMDNDPLNYTALLDENGNWKEWSTSMFVAPPEGSHLVYSSAKFRKKSAKNVTLAQIQKRFKQVKAFVAQNADKLHRIHFDIGEKLGGMTEGAPTAGEWAPDGVIAARDEQRNREDNYSNTPAIKPGTNVHIGHHVAGGSGIEGEVTKVDGEDVYIKNAEGQTYKGQLKNTTLQESSWMDKPGSGLLDADIASQVQDKFPEDDMLDIMAWEASAEEYGQPLTVDEYAKWRMLDDNGNPKDTNEDTIAKRKTGSDVHKKQSFADIFRSMDETEDDMVSRFKKELHDEKTAKALSKGANGKFNLAEDELTWGDELIEDLRLLLQDAERPNDVVDGVRDLIQQYEAPLNEMDVISSSHDSPIDRHVDDLGKALFVEAITLAKEVYNEEGAGRRSRAQNKQEYIEETLQKFLSKEYLRSIMGNIIETYNDNVDDYKQHMPKVRR